MKRVRIKLHVAVVIVGFRNTDDIAGCLEALKQSSYSDFSVVICENGGDESFDALSEMVSSVSGLEVELINARQNLGFAGGVNRGIAARREADAWWILNPDTRPHACALKELVSRLLVGDVVGVGGVLHYPDGIIQGVGGLWRGWLARAVSLGHGSQLGVCLDAATIESRMSYILGASILVSRRWIDDVGLMREDYFLYGEEVEWCLRARDAGLQLGFAPGARILHLQGTTTGSGHSVQARSRLSVFLDERNKLLVLRDTRPYQMITAAPAALLLLYLRFGRRGAWRQFRVGLDGWWAGLRGFRGRPDFLEN